MDATTAAIERAEIERAISIGLVSFRDDKEGATERAANAEASDKVDSEQDGKSEHRSRLQSWREWKRGR